MLLVLCSVSLSGCNNDYAFWPAPATEHSSQPHFTPPAPAPQLISIAVGPPDTTVVVGINTQFSATAAYSDGSRQDITDQATWSSSVASVALFNQNGQANGVVFALSSGSTEISASMAGVSGSTTLTVTSATLKSIAVNPGSSTLPKGTRQALVATGIYSNGARQNLSSLVTWSSSSESVASMGVFSQVTALNPGSTTITASFQAIVGSATVLVTAAVLETLEVTPANSTFAKGSQEPLVATGVYSDNSTVDLTAAVSWSSSDITVAPLSNRSGREIATAVSPGSARITATLQGITATGSVTVTAATLVSIDVTPSRANIAKGSTVQFTATGIYTDHATQNLTQTVSWNASDPAVAAVSNASGYEGLGTTLNPGSVTITAALDRLSGAGILTVTPATLVSIGVTPANPTVANGTTKQFAATGVFTDGSTQDLTAAVTWQSTDTSVAPVSNASGSNGLASSAHTGTTTISATLGSVSGSTALTITPATLVSIAVTPANLTISTGTVQQFTATGTYTDGSSQNLTAAVTWQSTDPSLATISNASGSNGLVSPIGRGTTTISATQGTVMGSTNLTVAGTTLVSISVTPASPTISIGSTQQFTATGTYSDGSTANLTLLVTWNSADPSIAAISNAAGSNGSAGATGIGPTRITASSSGVVSGPVTLTVIASSAYAYAINQIDNTVSEYAIGAGGALTPMQPVGTVSTGGAPSAIAIDPTGRYVYVTNQNDNSVSQYVVGAGGALTSMGPLSSGSLPIAEAIDPYGHYLYVVNYNDNTLGEYSIAAGGALAPIATVATGNAPFSIAVDPTGRYVYVVNSLDNAISQYEVGASGALTPNGTVNTGSYPVAIIAEPTGRYVYVMNYLSNAVSQYAIGAGGTLTPIGSGTVSTGSAPQALAADPAGHHVYGVNFYDNSISEFAIGADGSLSSIGSVPTGTAPYSITVEPAGRYLYVVNSSDNTVSQYTIDAAGALTPLGSPLATGGYPLAIVSGY